MGKWNNCIKCGYGWEQRRIFRPKQCPKCWTTDWDDSKPPRLKTHLNKLNVGDTRLYQWQKMPNGQPNLAGNLRMNRLIISYGHNTGKKFRREPKPEGLYVTRIL